MLLMPNQIRVNQLRDKWVVVRWDLKDGTWIRSYRGHYNLPPDPTILQAEEMLNNGHVNAAINLLMEHFEEVVLRIKEGT